MIKKTEKKMKVMQGKSENWKSGFGFREKTEATTDPKAEQKGVSITTHKYCDGDCLFCFLSHDVRII